MSLFCCYSIVIPSCCYSTLLLWYYTVMLLRYCTIYCIIKLLYDYSIMPVMLFLLCCYRMLVVHGYRVAPALTGWRQDRMFKRPLINIYNIITPTKASLLKGDGIRRATVFVIIPYGRSLSNRRLFFTGLLQFIFNGFRTEILFMRPHYPTIGNLDTTKVLWFL